MNKSREFIEGVENILSVPKLIHSVKKDTKLLVVDTAKLSKHYQSQSSEKLLTTIESLKQSLSSIKETLDDLEYAVSRM